MQLQKARNLVLGLFGVVIFTIFSSVSTFSADRSTPSSNLIASADSSPIHVVGRVSLVIPEKDQEEYNSKTKKLFELTNKLDQPILYTCNRDVNDSTTFVWDEEWKSYQHLQNHLNSDHFNEWWNYSKQFLKGELKVKYAKISDFSDV